MSDGTTHYENCWQSGAKHYACAVKELAACAAAFDRQQEQLDRNAEQIATLQKKKPWVGLTDDEIEHLRNDQPWWMVRDIEAKLKEKNT